MAQERRFQRTGVRWTGRTVTIMSAGTFVLLFAGVPAHAGATAAKPCPPPKNPAEAPAYWQCLWDNVQDGINPQPDPQKPDKPPAKPKPNKPAPDKPAKPDKSGNGSAPGRTRTPGAPSGGSAGGATAYTRPDGLRPYNSEAAARLPGLLPAPQVAPNAQATPTMGLGETRLITPVAAHEQQGDQMLWVAVASGAAGAVGAMNVSVTARRMRRRPGS
jgi:hypothetical protein